MILVFRTIHTPDFFLIEAIDRSCHGAIIERVAPPPQYKLPTQYPNIVSHRVPLNCDEGTVLWKFRVFSLNEH